MSSSTNRRNFLRQISLFTAGVGLSPVLLAACNSGGSKGMGDSASSDTSSLIDTSKELFFKISIAEWSFHKSIFGGKFDHLDFAKKASEFEGVTGIEYVNQFFKDKGKDMTYLGEMKKRAADVNMQSVLIMCDGEGELGDLDAKKRKQAVENHYKWVEAAKFLGCHSIRVNAAGNGSAEDVAKAAVEGLGSLTDFAKQHNIGVIVENHGGYSSNGEWLANVMKQVNKPECGTLPDFGNFCITREGEKCVDEFDRYKGTELMMPYAKGVSAKTFNFNEQGDEKDMDYDRIMKIVKDAGYKGFVGIEYEGNTLSEEEGIRKTIALLQKTGAKLS